MNSSLSVTARPVCSAQMSVSSHFHCAVESLFTFPAASPFYFCNKESFHAVMVTFVSVEMRRKQSGYLWVNFCPRSEASVGVKHC